MNKKIYQQQKYKYNQREFIRQLRKTADELEGRQAQRKSMGSLPFDALEKLIDWMVIKFGQLLKWLFRVIKRRKR